MAERWIGMERFQRAMRRAPDELKDVVADAVKETTSAVHSKGKSNIRSMFTRRSGTLEKNYRRGFSKARLEGRVGYLSKKARSEAFYARFLHDGTVKIEARPFHQNAVEAERERHQRRMIRARDRVLNIVARR